ncbi:RNA polymerase sigma factor [Spongiimicrobium salis]|uniref:RNA polymerase sigma factor n=1 Tax=Spongiimicrobium salis TaxID=1667022 RepID=UPI00374D5FA3
MKLELLIQKFQEKDVAAFEQLYDMYAKNICGAINIIVKNEVLAEEICQDVFMKIWEKSDRYNASKGRFFTWLLNIARNAAIDAVRSKSYRDEGKNLSADYFSGILELEDEHEDVAIDTVRLRKLVDGLKRQCIELIELLFFREYSQREVSEELDIPLGTIKTRSRSCISQLRENMGL